MPLIMSSNALLHRHMGLTGSAFLGPGNSSDRPWVTLCEHRRHGTGQTQVLRELCHLL
jgi:hypothetical protein